MVWDDDEELWLYGKDYPSEGLPHVPGVLVPRFGAYRNAYFIPIT